MRRSICVICVCVFYIEVVVAQRSHMFMSFVWNIWQSERDAKCISKLQPHGGHRSFCHLIVCKRISWAHWTNEAQQNHYLFAINANDIINNDEDHGGIVIKKLWSQWWFTFYRFFQLEMTILFHFRFECKPQSDHPGPGKCAKIFFFFFKKRYKHDCLSNSLYLIHYGIMHVSPNYQRSIIIIISMDSAVAIFTPIWARQMAPLWDSSIRYSIVLQIRASL